MLVFYQLHHVFPMFSIIYWTNLLILCPVPVSVYFVCELQKRSKNDSARNWLKIYDDFLSTGRLQKPEVEPEGSQGAPEAHQAPPLAAPGGHLGALTTASRRPFAYKFTLDLKRKTPGGIFQKHI